MASCIVYVGAARSVKALRVDASGVNGNGSVSNAEEAVTLTARDAAQFPLVGSAFLIVAYALIKIFGKEFLNVLLTLYFVVVGAFAIEGAIEGEFKKADWYRRRTWPVCVGSVVTVKPAMLASFVGQPTLDARLNFPQVCCWAFGILATAVYSWTKHWVLNNAIATCLCLTGVEMLSVGSFKNAAILLCGLFVYDVWWVFGTDVMVTVAKGIDGPIKLLFVRAWAADDAPDVFAPQFSMLGLGDVVIPGLFVALLLRFDARNADAKPSAELGEFSSPYFHVAMATYFGGLATTLYVMYAFNAAQPALLYLVPATLGGALATGLARQELAKLFVYTEEQVDETAVDAAPSSAAVLPARTRDAAKLD